MHWALWVAFAVAWALNLTLLAAVLALVRFVEIARTRAAAWLPPPTRYDVGDAIPQRLALDVSGGDARVYEQFGKRGGVLVFVGNHDPASDAVQDLLTAVMETGRDGGHCPVILVTTARSAISEALAQRLERSPSCVLLVDRDRRLYGEFQIVAVPTALRFDRAATVRSVSVNPHLGDWIAKALRLPAPLRPPPFSGFSTVSARVAR